MIVQKLVVDLLKELNPEKRGNVFEIDFMKTWVESCDDNLACLILTVSYSISAWRIEHRKHRNNERN